MKRPDYAKIQEELNEEARKKGKRIRRRVEDPTSGEIHYLQSDKGEPVKCSCSGWHRPE